MTRCSCCPCVPHRQPVLSSGPVPCRILFIAEAPHKIEDASGIGLSGPTGQEFNEGYLPLPGLFREHVHVTNAVLCSQPSYRNPKPEEAIACSGKHLPELLSRVQPEVIVTMGAVAAALFPDIQINLHHGIPQRAGYGDWNGILMATYHPSAGVHSTAYMIPLRQDFIALGVLLKQLDSGAFSWPSDPYPFTDYSVLSRVGDLSNYLGLESGFTYYEIGMDTEVRPGGIPHCLTLSHTPGTGRLIYAKNLAVLHALALYLHGYRPCLIFHNWLYDQKPCGEMGIPVDRFLDTMIRAYELGLGGGGDDDDEGAARGSLGLKTLAYRHLHMEMQSFKDLVLPYTLPHVLYYLSQAYSLLGSAAEQEPKCSCGHLQSDHQARGKTGRRTGKCMWDATDSGIQAPLWSLQEPHCGCQKWQKQALPKPDPAFNRLSLKLKRLSGDLESGQNRDPWKRIGDWHPWERDLMGEFLGPIPVLDIGLVPENALLGYACRDPDATLRLNSYLNTVRLR